MSKSTDDSDITVRKNFIQFIKYFSRAIKNLQEKKIENTDLIGPF
jgi:hypothetical protein